MISIHTARTVWTRKGNYMAFLLINSKWLFMEVYEKRVFHGMSAVFRRHWK